MVAEHQHRKGILLQRRFGLCVDLIGENVFVVLPPDPLDSFLGIDVIGILRIGVGDFWVGNERHVVLAVASVPTSAAHVLVAEIHVNNHGQLVRARLFHGRTVPGAAPGAQKRKATASAQCMAIAASQSHGSAA